MTKADELKAELESGAKSLAREAEKAKDRVVDAAADAMDEGKAAAATLTERASALAGQASETLSHGAGVARDALAATGEKVAETLRSASQSADLKAVQDKVSEAVSATAEALRDSSLSDMAGDLREAARRNPGLFLLGAAVAGFAVGAWMQSNATRSRSDDIIRRLRS